MVNKAKNSIKACFKILNYSIFTIFFLITASNAHYENETSKVFNPYLFVKQFQETDIKLINNTYETEFLNLFNQILQPEHKGKRIDRELSSFFRNGNNKKQSCWINPKMQQLEESLKTASSTESAKKVFDDFYLKARHYEYFLKKDAAMCSINLVKRDYKKDVKSIELALENNELLAGAILDENCKFYGKECWLSFPKEKCIDISNEDILDVLEDVSIFAGERKNPSFCFINFLKRDMPTAGAMAALERETFFMATDTTLPQERRDIIQTLEKLNILELCKDELEDLKNYEADFLYFTSLKSSNDDILEKSNISSYIYWKNVLKPNDSYNSSDTNALSWISNKIEWLEKNVANATAFADQSWFVDPANIDQAIKSISFLTNLRSLIINHPVILFFRPLASFFWKNGCTDITKLAFKLLRFSGKVPEDSTIGKVIKNTLDTKSYSHYNNRLSFNDFKKLWSLISNKNSVPDDSLKLTIQRLTVGDLLEDLGSMCDLVHTPLKAYAKQTSSNPFEKIARAGVDILVGSNCWSTGRDLLNCAAPETGSWSATSGKWNKVKYLTSFPFRSAAVLGKRLFTENTVNTCLQQFQHELQKLNNTLGLINPKEKEKFILKKLKRNILQPQIVRDANNLYEELTTGVRDFQNKSSDITNQVIPTLESCYHRLIGVSKFFGAVKRIVEKITIKDEYLLQNVFGAKLKTFQYLVKFVQIVNETEEWPLMFENAEEEAFFTDNYEAKLKEIANVLRTEFKTVKTKLENKEKLDAETKNSLENKYAKLEEALGKINNVIGSGPTENFVSLFQDLDSDFFKSNKLDFSKGVLSFIKNSSQIAKISSTFKKMKEMHYHFHPAYHGISELLSYIGILKLLKNAEKTPENKFSPVLFEKEDKAQLGFKDLWNPTVVPSIAPQTYYQAIGKWKSKFDYLPASEMFVKFAINHPIVPSSFTLGNGFSHQNMILTGPNARGKSTMMRSLFYAIHMGMTLGYVPAAAGSISPIHTFFSLKKQAEDASSGLSTHEGQVKLSKIMLDKILAASKLGKNCFISCDELFNGTNPRDGAALITSFVEWLNNNIGDHGIAIISTHCLNPKTLQYLKQRTGNKTGEYQITPERKLMPGFCDVTGDGNSTTAPLMKKYHHDEELIDMFQLHLNNIGHLD